MRLAKARRLLVVTALAAAALALPAQADTTTTTFTLSAGALSISVPASKDLGTTATGSASLTSHRVAFSATGVTGHNTASWSPTVIIRVPDTAVAGSYRGAIIHSVA
jgi:hypothetical protein